MKRIKIRLVTIACVFSVMVNAQDSTGSIETDRPDQTETASLVPKGYFQAEFGLNYEKIHDKNYSINTPTALLKYGLASRIELRMNITHRSDYIHLIPDPVTVEGLEPVEIGVKLALFEEKNARPKTSFIGHIGLSDLSSDVFKPRETIASLVFTMQHTVSETTSVGYNLGLKWEGESSSPLFAYTFAPGFNLSSRFYGFIESFGFIGKDDFHDHNIDAGIACLLNRNMKIDFAAGKGLSAASSEHFFTLGFSFRLPLRKSVK